ncbi:MAG: LPS-assembly protein LptD [Wenzhouxiangellaceae bacterium]
MTATAIIATRRPCLARAASWPLAVLLGLWTTTTPAQVPDGASSAGASCQVPGQMPDRGRLVRNDELPISVHADDYQSEGGGLLRASGNVSFRRGDQRLDTDELIYDQRTGELLLPGWLVYEDALVRIEADRARYHTRASSGRFDGVRYFIAGSAGAGHAALVEMRDAEHARVEGFDFTTCDIEDPDWQLKARSVELDFERSVGTARHARLEFKGVPILYSPWLSFPLDDQRKSGFLYPLLGSSSDNGLDLALPYYWNIAPDRDATFTPRLIADRGLLLGTEYRFLGRRQRGELRFDYLPDDRKLDSDRWLARFDYRARLAQDWRLSIDFNRVDDPDHFIDLGNDLESSAIQFLRSDLSLSGHGRYWDFSATVDTFQVLDRAVTPEREPYDRLPRLEFSGDWPLYRDWRFRLRSEAVYFDRSTGVTGMRLDLNPEIGLRMVRPGWFFEPRLGLRATAWNLDDQATGQSTPSRVQPILSLDGGLFFERDAGSDLIQTLEPRVFYLYVPYRNQDDLPLFDTRELTFGFAQLFQTNRYTGADRQTDANQLTLALTSRLIRRDSGHSLLDASIGQIFYFDDPDTTLNGEAPASGSLSATVGEINWRPTDRFLVSAGLQWDPDDTQTQVAALSVGWKGRDARQFRVGYRFRRDQVDQIDLRARVPVSSSLRLIGRFGYAFDDDATLEAMGGIEYESCCWALVASVRRYLNDRDRSERTAVFLELHLKGLGSLGRRPYALFPE